MLAYVAFHLFLLMWIADFELLNVATQTPVSMHEVLLGGWGCPIGEFFALEELSEMCKQQKRWTFFLTSEVCNVPGGVAR